MSETIEGTQRYLVTRYTVEEADTFEALPREFKDTISEIHFAEKIGMQGTYGIDLDDEWARKVGQASNLIQLLNISRLGLGEYVEHTTSELIEPLGPYVEDLELPELDPVRLSAPEDERVLAQPPEKLWPVGPVLDQGREGACTGFCGANFINAEPIMKRPFLANQDALAYYQRNKQIDEWPGENYNGSSVSAMCKQLIELGRIRTAGVTASFEEMAKWKLYRGTLMLSVPWYEGLYTPDARGYIRPTGRKVGGHAILDSGITRWRAAVLFNSWGADYGFGGRAYLAEPDYRWLIGRGMRAYTAVQVA